MAKRKRHMRLGGNCLGIIELDIFNLDVAVFETDADRMKVLEAQGCAALPGNPTALSSAHREFTDSGKIRLSMVIKPGVSGAIWAHECVHIADFVMDYLCLPTCVDNTEIRAYMVQHLFAGLENIIRKPQA